MLVHWSVANREWDVLLKELLVLSRHPSPNFIEETAAESVLVRGSVHTTLIYIDQLHDFALSLLLVVRDECLGHHLLWLQWLHAARLLRAKQPRRGLVG